MDGDVVGRERAHDVLGQSFQLRLRLHSESVHRGRVCGCIGLRAEDLQGDSLVRVPGVGRVDEWRLV